MGTDTSSSNPPVHVQTPDGSTLSAETAQDQGRGSSWLAPWSWYGQSTSTPAPGIPQPEQGGANRVEVNTEPAKSAEAEAVKETPIQQQPASPVHVEPTNPIQSSITANISSWSSFFSSKALLTKRIADTEHREEDTMEVMDVDEGDDERGSTVAPVEISEAVGKHPVALQLRVSNKLTPAPQRSPSPSPKPKAKPDDLKGTKRTSVSPAPSKSSGRASPRVPPPPNLVLPTWDDTFLNAPRSTVPSAQTDSALAKTVRFVSGMLFTKGDGGSMGMAKAPSKGNGHLADFGRELPRIWDVIGERLDGDTLRGCKRVVVIGIHGWFPGTSADILQAFSGQRRVRGKRLMLTFVTEQVRSCGPYWERCVSPSGVVLNTDAHIFVKPTGTSNKLVTMMCQALEAFQEQHGVEFEKVTQIPLEGEGTISKRVDKCVHTRTTLSRLPEILKFFHLQTVQQFESEPRMDERSPCGGRNLGGNAFPGFHRFNTFARSTNPRQAHQDFENVGPLVQRLGGPRSRRHHLGRSLCPKGVLFGALRHPPRTPSISKFQFSATTIHTGELK